MPHYFNTIGDATPWLVGLMAVCALAAMQSTGAAYMSTAGGMLTRDLYKRYLNPTASHATQKLFGRMGVAFIVIWRPGGRDLLADALVLLGGLAVAFGFQMWPSLAAVCWFPWITRQGATWGLAAGLIAVIFTETIGQQITGGALPWGRWPWTIHSAGWGIIFNLAVCIPVSAMTQNRCRDGAGAPHEVSQLPARARVPAGGQEASGSDRLDHHSRLDVLRNRPGRGDRQHHLWCAGSRRRRLGPSASRRSGPGRSCSGSWASE